jgi:serine/threonine-protein kinase HipA
LPNTSSWTNKKPKQLPQVGKAVAKWRDEASRHGMTKGEIDRMASAFEHEDLQLAQRN